MERLSAWMVGLMFLGVAFAERWRSRKGLGVRTIQILSILLVVPTLIVLSVEGKVEGESIMALLGTIVGFTLSGLSSFDFRKKNRSQK